jgi:hypothetical protein
MNIMPSATNLVAAFVLAAVAVYASLLIPPLLPEGTDIGYLHYVNAGIGALVGWQVIGSRTGRGWVSGINAGLTGAVMLVFWALFVQSCNEMTRQALRNRYDSVFEAIAAIVQIGAEWAIMIATIPIISGLLIGGAIAGLLGEFAARRWN